MMSAHGSMLTAGSDAVDCVVMGEVLEGNQGSGMTFEPFRMVTTMLSLALRMFNMGAGSYP